MGSVREFRCDTNERSPCDFGKVHQAFHSGQRLMNIFRGAGLKRYPRMTGRDAQGFMKGFKMAKLALFVELRAKAGKELETEAFF